jgi:hypothetical protein
MAIEGLSQREVECFAVAQPAVLLEGSAGQRSWGDVGSNSRCFG